MTAFVALAKKDEVVVLTDGAMYDKDGVFRGESSKLWPIPHLNCVVSGSGTLGSIVYIMLVVNARGHRTFDDMAADLGNILRDASKSPDFPMTEKIAIYVAGISETRGPEILAVSNFAHFQSGFVPFEVRTVPAIFQPADQEIMEYIDGTFPDVEEFEGERDGLRLLRYMRQSEIAPIGGGDITIGGHVQLAVIRKDEIATKVLHRWPDAIGERIDRLSDLRAIPGIEIDDDPEDLAA